MTENQQKSRVKSIAGAVIFGVLTIFLIFLSIKALMQYDNMEPIREGAAVVTDGRILRENEGKVVIVSGRAEADGITLSDTDFDVTVQSPYLERHVEMRQWVNSRGYGQENGTMEVRWSSFVERDQDNGGNRYYNPDSIPFKGAVFSSTVKLGEFKLSDELFEKLLRLPDRITNATELTNKGADRNGLQLKGNEYFFDNRKLYGFGDVRVYFTKADTSRLGEITVMAKQEEGMLTAYDTEEISPISLLYDGIISKDKVLRAAKSDEKSGTITMICLIFLFAGLTVLYVRRYLKP